MADAANTLASPGLLQFAQQHGLWDPAQGPFNFFTAYHANTSSDARCAEQACRCCCLEPGGRAPARAAGCSTRPGLS